MQRIESGMIRGRLGGLEGPEWGSGAAGSSEVTGSLLAQGAPASGRAPWPGHPTWHAQKYVAGLFPGSFDAEISQLRSPVRRQRLSILAADIAGYCRLVEQDELATVLRVRHLQRFLIEPLTTAHGGTVVDWAGDGALAGFPTAAHAVDCAVALQGEMARQERFTPAADRIRFRIGISAGEVLVLDSEFYGSTVNVAARLQAMAGPGEIFLSDHAFDQLDAPTAAWCEDLGPRRLRKMATTVKVYKIPRSAFRKLWPMCRAA